MFFFSWLQLFNMFLVLNLTQNSSRQSIEVEEKFHNECANDIADKSKKRKISMQKKSTALKNTKKIPNSSINPMYKTNTDNLPECSTRTNPRDNFLSENRNVSVQRTFQIGPIKKNQKSANLLLNKELSVKSFDEIKKKLITALAYYKYNFCELLEILSTKYYENIFGSTLKVQITCNAADYLYFVIHSYFEQINISPLDLQKILESIKHQLSNLNWYIHFYLATFNPGYHILRIRMIADKKDFYIYKLKSLESSILQYLSDSDLSIDLAQTENIFKSFSFVEYLYGYLELYLKNYNLDEYQKLLIVYIEFVNSFYLNLSNLNASTSDKTKTQQYLIFATEKMNLAFQTHMSNLTECDEKQNLYYALESCNKQLENLFHYSVFTDPILGVQTRALKNSYPVNDSKVVFYILHDFKIHLESWSNWRVKEIYHLNHEKKTIAYKLSRVFNVFLSYLYGFKTNFNDETNLEILNAKKHCFNAFYNFYSYTNSFLAFYLFSEIRIDYLVLLEKLKVVTYSLRSSVQSIFDYVIKLNVGDFRKEQQDIIKLMEEIQAPLLNYLVSIVFLTKKVNENVSVERENNVK
ncbi:hypothetical protein EDEG_01041 [Edhazardia aedis USNM 41457]|uniref:Uncharacterized protein n=1 Tax=Edhazardia aedis (strain USNM 41457) TaxID=1003232 RepID=J9DAH8_EDHAE|nr:hypothetical protein EDEG_01041 [Edhazardia aedis USNM 41457]|eukprot:EJW04751.1 hypothetical protein EDEG_01041 [Edhazardia aedis USNM 41457]